MQAFNLTGAHTELECKECHNDPELQYQETPTACVNCHTEEERPDSHPQFGSDCQRCHDTTAFAPARLTQHTFDLEHGMVANEEIGCKACHTLSYTAVNCLDCHADEPADGSRTRRAGAGDGIGNCVTCHPTGTPGDAGGDNFPAQGRQAAGEQRQRW